MHLNEKQRGLYQSKGTSSLVFIGQVTEQVTVNWPIGKLENYLKLSTMHLSSHDSVSVFVAKTLTGNRPFSKMAAENLNKSKLKTNTSTRKSTLTLVNLPSLSVSGEITAEKMYVEN